MKAVLISVRPQWCEKICHQIGTKNGKPIYEKSLEIRKTRPKLATPFKCYIYCTLSGSNELFNEIGLARWFIEKWSDKKGKVIGEFVCDNIRRFDVPYPAFQSELDKSVLADSCCTYYMLHRYAYYDALYGWHISDLKIYDKPQELSEFKQCDKCPYGDKARCNEHEFSCDGTYVLSRAPQSWCYVEDTST